MKFLLFCLLALTMSACVHNQPKSEASSTTIETALAQIGSGLGKMRNEILKEGKGYESGLVPTEVDVVLNVTGATGTNAGLVLDVSQNLPEIPVGGSANLTLKHDSTITKSNQIIVKFRSVGLEKKIITTTTTGKDATTKTEVVNLDESINVSKLKDTGAGTMKKAPSVNQ